ncbi:tryptophan--tRNA ligase [Marinicellulosiphila megalodicopiae]|uniref:tryptophan--tRNA ligase n=1 Tax=Marinicellulosiphila megalodicopiae TaxID=2724896 RepID=UPI003BB1B8ED
MTKQTVLTGITTTGIPHLGNYAGAIKPAIEASKNTDVNSFFFLADYHALIKCQDPKRIAESSKAIAATWLALGLDTDNVTFYRQSDIPEIPQLSWVLTCNAAKGLMNRAHAYKAAVQDNLDGGEQDGDKGINMGLFSYPILMAADMLMFNANQVPVGKDQIQHIEMARDIAGRFNHHFGDTFALPQAVIDDSSMILPGLDGRKMSKSYDNTIPLFETEKKLKKAINKIVTNSLEPGEPKDFNDSAVFDIYSAFASESDIESMKQKFVEGIGWGNAKKELFELINEELSGPREEYNRLMQDSAYLESVLQKGAEKARAVSGPFMSDIRKKLGMGIL